MGLQLVGQSDSRKLTFFDIIGWKSIYPTLNLRNGLGQKNAQLVSSELILAEHSTSLSHDQRNNKWRELRRPLCFPRV